MLGYDCSHELELKDENGHYYFRAAYVSKSKTDIKLRVYNKIVAEIDRKYHKKSILVKNPAPITARQIAQFFKTYEEVKK